jgi:small-conductance mechanosensitive channel
LLSEQSIQVNDMIEIAGSNVSGLVRHTGARYTLIETLDAREIMIPNDDLVTNRVINWTFTDAKGVLRLDIGVSYESDIELARDQLIEAAKAHPSVLRNPPPNCLLRGFGASSVDFSLFFSVKDVRERRAGIQSEVLFDIWHRFKEHGIDIPYPQMTVHYAPPMDGQDAPATAEAKKTEGKNPVG